jgi:xanthine dehydrogenase accessory factor
MLDELLIMIKGAGDLATGVGWRLRRCGFPVVMTEMPQPSTVRRTVAFAQAVYDGEHTVEGITARRCLPADVPDILLADEVPVLVDPEGASLADLAPSVLVDAIVAKTNTGSRIDDAPLVVALGPGFSAGDDCHAVIETHRGHNLGRVIWQGRALADTGMPGSIPGMGVDVTRVLRAPVSGRLRPYHSIGDTVESGATIAVITTVEGEEALVVAPFAGVLRGLIHERAPVNKGLKIGDLDPRAQPAHAWTLSDKSLAIGGGVLEAILSWHFNQHANHTIDLDDLDEAYL